MLLNFFKNKKIFRFLPNPIFVIYVIIAVLYGKIFPLTCAIISLAIHEIAHLSLARKLGFKPESFSLTPFGATLSFDCGLSDSDSFKVALVGPLANLIICPFIVALWWLCPSMYPFTHLFCQTNFSLALFNLLPVFPFDGGRIILSLCKNKLSAYKKLKLMGIIIAVIFIAFGVYLIVSNNSFTVTIAGFAILWSTAFTSQNERYRLIFDNTGVIKDFSVPFTKKEIFVHENARLGSLLKQISCKNCQFTVNIVDNSLRTIKTINGEDVNMLFFKNRNLTVKETILR